MVAPLGEGILNDFFSGYFSETRRNLVTIRLWLEGSQLRRKEREVAD